MVSAICCARPPGGLTAMKHSEPSPSFYYFSFFLFFFFFVLRSGYRKSALNNKRLILDDRNTTNAGKDDEEDLVLELGPKTRDALSHHPHLSLGLRKLLDVDQPIDTRHPATSRPLLPLLDAPQWLWPRTRSRRSRRRIADEFYINTMICQSLA